MNWLLQLLKELSVIFAKPTYKTDPTPETTIPPAPASPDQPAPVPHYLWDTFTNCRHSARVIMDEMGLTGVLDKATGREAKDVLTACIMQESQFNPKAVGKLNYNMTRDYGLCQYNNGTNRYGQAYWIGKNAPFASTEEVLNDPEKNVRIMVRQYQAGNLHLWASYSTGAYKRWL